MMTTLFLLCFALTDIWRPSLPDDPVMQFSVTELTEESTTGCATLPQNGRVMDQSLTIDLVASNEPSDTSTVNTLLPVIASSTLSDTVLASTVMPYEPPGLPDPEPETPPVAVVPEPPTAAILAISGLVLLYLLFGRKQRKYSV